MEQKKMTMQEAEKKIDTYKEIFSVVRLLKGEEIEEILHVSATVSGKNNICVTTAFP